METNYHKGLLDKYWDGTSSLEEEQILRKYLATPEGRSAHPEEASMFGFFSEQKELKTKITDFPVEKLETTKKSKIVSFTYIRNIAAAVLILFGVYSVWNTNQDTTTTNYVEIEDPKEALRITQEALALVSRKVYDGEKIMKQNIAKLSFTNIIKH